jgi:hypothetical protein
VKRREKIKMSFGSSVLEKKYQFRVLGKWCDRLGWGPGEPFAWRQWQYFWEARDPGDFRVRARVTDKQGQKQPWHATWNVLGYGNNGVTEHSIPVRVE